MNGQNRWLSQISGTIYLLTMFVSLSHSRRPQLSSIVSTQPRASVMHMDRTHPASDPIAVAPLQVAQSSSSAIVPRFISSRNTPRSDDSISLDRVNTRHLILTSLIGAALVVLLLTIFIYIIMKKRCLALQTKERGPTVMNQKFVNDTVYLEENTHASGALRSQPVDSKSKFISHSATLRSPGSSVLVISKPKGIRVLTLLSALSTKALSFLKTYYRGLARKSKKSSNFKEAKRMFLSGDVSPGMRIYPVIECLS